MNVKGEAPFHVILERVDLGVDIWYWVPCTAIHYGRLDYAKLPLITGAELSYHPHVT